MLLLLLGPALAVTSSMHAKAAATSVHGMEAAQGCEYVMEAWVGFWRVNLKLDSFPHILIPSPLLIVHSSPRPSSSSPSAPDQEGRGAV